MGYGKFNDFKKELINKRVVMWSEDKLVLHDGTVVEIKMSEHDCCAWAEGKFKNAKLDAMIADVSNLEDVDTKTCKDSGETESYGYIKIYSNQNIVAQAELNANDGNGGYYYSVISAKVNNVYYPLMNDRGEDLTKDSVAEEYFY